MHKPLVIPTDYIDALEEVLNVPFASEVTRETNRYLTKTANAVASISQGLTVEREEFVRSKYLKKQEARNAYLLYYMTTNLLKLWPPLRELEQSKFFSNRNSVRHLDLGSGPGTGIWSLLLFLEDFGIECASEFTLSDSLRENLSAGEQFYRLLSKKLKNKPTGSYETWDMTKPGMIPTAISAKGSYDLITLMNVINELPESNDEVLIASLEELLAAKGALIVIEPSTRELSRRALRFRDRMVAKGMQVYAPCTHQLNCPALQDPDNWCHTEVPWERPPFIKTIDDQAGTLRLSLKFTYTTYLKQEINQRNLFMDERQNSAGRVVSQSFREKGRTRFVVCSEMGLKEHVLNKRDQNKGNGEAAKVERYDLVGMNGVEVREHDVKIGPDAVFNINSDSSGASDVDKWGQG